MSLAQNVRTTFMACLYKEEEILGLAPGESPKDTILVPAIRTTVGFHGERLRSYKETVRGFVELMDSNFMLSDGGGMSFLNLCMDKDGNQWGEQQTCEMLMAMAFGLGMGGFLMERPLWRALPGGMPYLWLDPTVP